MPGAAGELVSNTFEVGQAHKVCAELVSVGIDGLGLNVTITGAEVAEQPFIVTVYV